MSQTLVEEAVPADIPGVCSVCGGRSIAPEGSSSALLAVCDVLVVRSLEVIGKKIVRAGSRNRYALLNGRPWHSAHTIWGPEEHMVSKSLDGAWDVVPALLDTHGCCGVTSRQVVEMLDRYVRDLVAVGEPHDILHLARRFKEQLGLPVYLKPAHHAHHA